MKKLIFTGLAILAFSLVGRAQVYMRDINGTPFSERNLSELGGSPFFNDQFLKGSLKLEDNSIYKDIYLRYDLESDQLVYRNEANSASMLPNGKIIQFSIDLPNGPAVFKAVADDQKTTGFYQVLKEGKATLLKKTKKRIVENVEYNSTSKSKSLKTEIDYFVQKDNAALIPVKKDKKSFTKALSDKEAEVVAFINQTKLNLKADEDMIKLIGYYNTL